MDFINTIQHGDALDILPQIPDASVDIIFADPPYYLQLQKPLWRPDQSQVDAVTDDWDKFQSYDDYDEFTRKWLTQAQRVMKDRSSIWVSGTYHNIFRVGAIMQDLGFWMLNTISWFKPNATPNFNGTRLKNDVEFIIWAKKSAESNYNINYHLLKRFNDGKQLGSVWHITTCKGAERLVDENGEKLHSTQKPVDLLRRILLASGNPEEVVLDPFSGTGTTAAVAKELHMRYIGIEQDERYVRASRKRLLEVDPMPTDDSLFLQFAKRKPPRVAFKKLVTAGYLQAGDVLYFDEPEHSATIQPNGKLRMNGSVGTIHSFGRTLKDTQSCNGWKHWFYEDAQSGERQLIDVLRQQYRREELGL